MIYGVFDAVGCNPTIDIINSHLRQRNYEEITPQDYALWAQYYYPISKRHLPVYEGVINKGEPLVWIARYLRAQAQKESLS